MIGTGLLFTLFCVIVIISGMIKPDDPAKKEEALVELKKEYAILAGLKPKIPALSSLKQQSCPDSEIATKVKTEKKWLPVIPSEYFSVFEGTPEWKEIKKDWKWLYPLESFSYLEDLGSLREINDLKWRISQMYKNSPYLGFLVTSEKRLPKLADEKTFISGSIQGWIVIFDLETKNKVCQVPLEVFNSEDVKFKTRGMFSKNSDEAVLDDFKSQYKTQVREALKKISKAFEY